MAVAEFLIERLLSEVGLFGLFSLWVLYQVYSPSWMPETKFQKAHTNIENEIRETKQLLISSITVLRAVVRTNEDVDTAKVDEYLVENGVEPDDFIATRPKRGPPGDD